MTQESSEIFRAFHGWQGMEQQISFIQLRESAIKERFPPVLLITGQSGLGKRRMAHFVAALGVCETRSGCGQCAPCQRILKQTQEEVLSYTGDEKFTVEDAQNSQMHLSYLPNQVPGSKPMFRSLIITDAERMTLQAANRLLKTLEEPGQNVLILLVTSRTHRLPVTIRSLV